MITNATRTHLMAARDDVFRAGDGHPNVDLALVASHIDNALRALCPHLPVTWKTRPDDHGRNLTTCYACGMSWYDHENDPPQVSYRDARQHASYMVTLGKRLKTRAVEHGFAYVTPYEGERLQSFGLYQPGHTVHRFSTESEDRSDAALEEREIEIERESDQAAARELAEANVRASRILTESHEWHDRMHAG